MGGGGWAEWREKNEIEQDECTCSSSRSPLKSRAVPPTQTVLVGNFHNLKINQLILLTNYGTGVRALKYLCGVRVSIRSRAEDCHGFSAKGFERNDLSVVVG